MNMNPMEMRRFDLWQKIGLYLLSATLSAAAYELHQLQSIVYETQRKTAYIDARVEGLEGRMSRCETCLSNHIQDDLNVRRR